MKIDWRVFDLIRKHKQTYQQTFASPVGQEVLRDLAKFCRAAETCFDTDTHVQANLEGRREVWLRIQKFLNLSSEQLYGILNGTHIQLQTTEEDKHD